MEVGLWHSMRNWPRGWEIFNKTGQSTEKKMFGGIAFMLNGNMCCGVINDLLMARVGRDRYEASLALPHVRPMDFTGKPMTGYVYVEPGGYRERRRSQSLGRQVRRLRFDPSGEVRC